MSCLYVFINPLLLASFAHIFSRSEACVFILSFEGMGVKKIVPGWEPLAEGIGQVPILYISLNSESSFQVCFGILKPEKSGFELNI